MGVTSYYSFGGEILGEETGGIRRDYLTDALGSVTATVMGAATVENTYRYKPYGEQLAKTGTGSDPKFLWNGKWGYRKFNQKDIYIRARYFSEKLGIWITVDPLWPNEKAYVYARNSPVYRIDKTGNGVEEGKDGINRRIGMVCNSMLGFLASEDQIDIYQQINQCVSESGLKCQPFDRKRALCVSTYACGRTNVNYLCNCKSDDGCAWVNNMTRGVPGGCLGPNAPHDITMNVCANSIYTSDCNSFGTPTGVAESILHEILHCCGLKHGDRTDEPMTCNTVMSCCFFKIIGMIPRGTKCKQ